MSTDVEDFISSLDGGIVEQKLSQILSEVSAAVIEHDKAGKVSLEFSIKRVPNSYQVQIEHQIKYSRPTAKGKVSEENKTSTPMHVGSKGRLSLFPENQGQMFTKEGRPVTGDKN